MGVEREGVAGRVSQTLAAEAMVVKVARTLSIWNAKSMVREESYACGNRTVLRLIDDNSDRGRNEWKAGAR